MRGAGGLRDRVIFQSRGGVSDGYGNKTTGPFETRFSRAAGFRPLHGGEGVIAARLTGTQPYVLTVRRDSQTATVTTDWRAVDARNPTRVFNITAITDPTGKRQWLEMLVTEGGAT